MNRDEAIEKSKTYLSERELHAYGVWCGMSKPHLSPALNAQLYQLFLMGKDTEEIRRMNPTLSLGEIVAARVEGQWDERKTEYLDSLLDKAQGRVQQATLEQIDLMCDVLSLARKEQGDKIKRYIQTGNDDDKPDVRIDGIRTLKTAIEILQTLTGKDRQSRVLLTGDLTHKVEAAISKQPTSQQAEEVLKLLLQPTTK